ADHRLGRREDPDYRPDAPAGGGGRPLLGFRGGARRSHLVSPGTRGSGARGGGRVGDRAGGATGEGERPGRRRSHLPGGVSARLHPPHRRKPQVGDRPDRGGLRSQPAPGGGRVDRTGPRHGRRGRADEPSHRRGGGRSSLRRVPRPDALQRGRVGVRGPRHGPEHRRGRPRARSGGGRDGDGDPTSAAGIPPDGLGAQAYGRRAQGDHRLGRRRPDRLGRHRRRHNRRRPRRRERRRRQQGRHLPARAGRAGKRRAVHRGGAPVHDRPGYARRGRHPHRATIRVGGARGQRGAGRPGRYPGIQPGIRRHTGEPRLGHRDRDRRGPPRRGRSARPGRVRAGRGNGRPIRGWETL
ncbi:MAG: Methylthioribose-1-phosphate isomerase, partial [uncultured Rubrobacteraceae bacterium]